MKIKKIALFVTTTLALFTAVPRVSADSNVQKVIDETYVKPDYVLGYSLDQSQIEQTLSLLNYDSSKDKEKDEEAKNSTLGTKIVSNEAHYFYPFSINPSAYKEFVALGVTDGYTEEDYLNFKRTALVAATSFSSNAKEGCQNEFALFVETKLDTYLPNLSEYISFEKTDINKIKIECNMLNELEDILNIEIYYNPETTVLESNLQKAKTYNLITKKEV